MKTLFLSIAIATMPVWAFAQGTIVEDTLILHLTTAEIDVLLSDAGLPSGILTLDYEVDVHRIVYETLSPNGNTGTTASGLVFIPTNVPCPLPLISYMHGTKVVKEETFYYLRDEWFLGAVMASSGYVMSMPDYLGLGMSPGFHPYQHNRSQATATIDLLRVAKTICADTDVDLNGQLFLTGYSQGGHACLGTHQIIQEEYANEFTVTASAPGSGPYNLSGNQFDMVAAMEPYAVPGYLPYLILSYQSVYGDWYTNYSDIFTPPYDQTLPPLFDGTHSFGEINEAMNDTPRLVIVPEYADAFFGDPNHPAMVALRENDVYDWVPEAPVLLNYCSSDQEVTYLNALFTEQWMNDLGATNVTSIERSSTLSHYECAQPTLLFSKGWFDSLVEWCPAGVNDREVMTDVNVQPNLVQDGFIRLTNSYPVELTLTDLSGRQLLQRSVRDSNAAIPLPEGASGMYFVTVRSGNAQRVQRIVAL
jgi:hypothetical protein